jgi:hypothetical protein
MVAKASQGTTAPAPYPAGSRSGESPGPLRFRRSGRIGSACRPDEVVVHGGGGHQGRYGGMAIGDVPVGSGSAGGRPLPPDGRHSGTRPPGRGSTRPAVGQGPADGEVADFRSSCSDSRMAARSAGVEDGLSRYSWRQCKGRFGEKVVFPRWWWTGP